MYTQAYVILNVQLKKKFSPCCPGLIHSWVFHCKIFKFKREVLSFCLPFWAVTFMVEDHLSQSQHNVKPQVLPYVLKIGTVVDKTKQQKNPHNLCLFLHISS